MPISAILLYEQVRGDLKRLPRTFFFPPRPPPFYPPSSEVYKAVRRIYRATYTHNVYTHTHAHTSELVYVCMRAVVRRHGIHRSLPSACTHYSRRTCTKYLCTRTFLPRTAHVRARSSPTNAHKYRRASVRASMDTGVSCVCVCVRRQLPTYHIETRAMLFFPSSFFPPFFFSFLRKDRSIYKAVTNEP